MPALVAPIEMEIALSNVQHGAWESHRYYSALLGVEPEAEVPRLRLRHHGWRVVPAEETCRHPAAYRSYIRNSRAEFSVAKHGYVAGGCGWFSGRSACYLATGRPVVVQDTGFAATLPTGRGVLAFASPEEARLNIEALEADYDQHARAARDLAHEYFDAEKVLTKLLTVSAPLQGRR